MIRGSTYPIDVVSRSPVGWEEKYFDSGTGRLEIRNRDEVLATIDLDSYRIAEKPGHYRIYYTMPVHTAITIQAYGTVDSYQMRTNEIVIALTGG